MGASLMQPCRVYEEGLRVVKYFQREEGVKLIPLLIDVTRRRSTGNSVPAAAVIRRVQALIGITGRKRTHGGVKSDVKSRAQPGNCI